MGSENGYVKGAGTGKHNALNMQQQFRLLDLMRSRAERYQNERPRFEAVAEELSKEIGFALTESNIRNVCKAAGIRWVPKIVRPRREPGRGPTRGARVRVLEVAVQKILGDLGLPSPPEWDQWKAEARAGV